ncbi:S41 family peptidase [Nonomuraea glycinis]|uniref:S41 family peptidase n=1 Tax=Nonomuraea glycinis TaxID=2047744 RepID=UPI0033B40147
MSDLKIVDVTDGRFEDTEPTFTRDGRFIAFLSKRSFEPIRDQHFVNLSFPIACRPYIAALSSTLSWRDSFADVAGRPRIAKDEQPHEVEVDIEGLQDRVLSLPVEDGLYSSLQAVDGGLVWLKGSLQGTIGAGAASTVHNSLPDVHVFDLHRGEYHQGATEARWCWASADGSRLIVRRSGGVSSLLSPLRKGGEASFEIDLSPIRVLSDPVSEWRLGYAEAGRVYEEDFWDVTMGGVDWHETLSLYRGLIDRISTPNEFVDLLLEVAGELGTSHAYVNPPYNGRSSEPMGKLGADFVRVVSGPSVAWKIAKIFRGEPADPMAISPLMSSGAQVSVGDEILEIGGVAVDPAIGPLPLLSGSANSTVEITMASGHTGDLYRVIVRPIADEQYLRYHEWVRVRRALVHRLSGGRVGYVHIPDLMGYGYAHFHRDLRTEFALDGLIVDFRNNRGGSASQLVVERLAKRVLAWGVGRVGAATRYPADSRRGFIVFCADENAGSGGDVLAAVVKSLKMGPIVGTRTWGGTVLYRDPPHGLVDGTHIYVPHIGMWFDSAGWSVENHGVEPDIEVLISPEDWAVGRDSQLLRAVDLAMDSINSSIPLLPPQRDVSRPSKRRPTLPPQ